MKAVANPALNSSAAFRLHWPREWYNQSRVCVLAEKQSSQWIWVGDYEREMAEQELKRNSDSARDSILVP